MEYYTNSQGQPVPTDTVGAHPQADGLSITKNIHFLGKMAHFNRERIPERVVHAKGTGAFGTFDCYRSLSKYTLASFLQGNGQRTKVFVRFSTSIGSKGSADTARDMRGFAVKFYTRDGIYDIVGSNIPVFFLQDAARFPDLIHCCRPSPDSNLHNSERFWDFCSLQPETTHMLTWLYSDHGTMKDYCHMDGFSVNAFVFVNRQGERILVRYHFKSKQGVETLSRIEAARLAGTNPDIASELLYDSIHSGAFPKWELCLQLMRYEDAGRLGFDPLDVTKVWPEELVPSIPAGLLTLNETPANYFAQVEQAAFSPGNLIPGIELINDGLLPARAFAYSDTQRYRLGANYAQLPVNYPATKVINNERDGKGCYMFNPDAINYCPNTLNKNQPMPYPLPEASMRGGFKPFPPATPDKDSNFSQAGKRYRSLSALEQAHLIDNLAFDLYFCNNEIVTNILSFFKQADDELGSRLLDAILEYRSK